MKEKNSFTVINDEGKEVVCDVLFTFDSDETNKSYIAYTDNTKDENSKCVAITTTEELPRTLADICANRGAQKILLDGNKEYGKFISSTILEQAKTTYNLNNIEIEVI